MGFPVLIHHLWSNAWIKAHSTLSYASLIFVAIKLIWQELLVWRPWNISWEMSMLSVIKQPATKSDCVFEICVGRQHFNIWHNTFEMILYPTLDRLIGCSSVIFVGLSIFGIKQMFVQPGIQFSCSQKIIHQIKKVLLYDGSWVLKEKAVMPSRPGAFFGCIMNKDVLTSSSDGGLINHWFIWWVIFSGTSCKNSSNSVGHMQLSKSSKYPTATFQLFYVMLSIVHRLHVDPQFYS